MTLWINLPSQKAGSPGPSKRLWWSSKEPFTGTFQPANQVFNSIKTTWFKTKTRALWDPSAGKKHFLRRPTFSSQSPWKKEKTNSQKLSSDLYTGAVACTSTLVSTIIIHKIKSKKSSQLNDHGGVQQLANAGGIKSLSSPPKLTIPWGGKRPTIINYLKCF